MARPAPPAPPPAPPSSMRLRATAVLVVVVCLFATLMGRLWYLQGVSSASQIGAVGAQQAYKTVYIPAPRGEIFDRNGKLLVGNRIERVVTVDRNQVLANPDLVGKLAALLGESVNQVNAAVGNLQYSPYQPVPVATGVSQQVALTISENQASFPGVSVQDESVPYYPHGSLASNILGYVSQITASEYAKMKGERCGGVLCYMANSEVGQAGVEETYEKYLRGKPGVKTVEVDSQGNVLGTHSYTPPVPGDDLVLSISLTDQKAAEQDLQQGMVAARTTRDIASGHLYRSPASSMVVEDPRNGQLLALATSPDYNAADFNGGISVAKWKYYNNPANHYPLLDRAISNGYAPGSTWKLITATAMLDYGLRSPSTMYDDTGAFTVGNQVFHDNADSGGGWVNLQQAITISSDAYFYSLGYQFWQLWANRPNHPEYLQKIAGEYGFGHYTGIDLPGESAGVVPSQQVFTKQHRQYPKAYPDAYFYPGQEVQEAIGQGEDLVTPLQLADAYATFANGGTLYVPHVGWKIEAPGTGGQPSGKIIKVIGPQVKDHVQMPAGYDRQAMLAGFEGVTSSPRFGTAAGAFTTFPLSKYPIGGKTGTAQIGPDYPTIGWPKYIQDTSVFTSFAPATNPRFVVDAVFEQSGYGASVAAPAVEREYQTLFGLNKPKPHNSATTTTLGPAATTTVPAATTTVPAATTTVPAATTVPVATTTTRAATTTTARPATTTTVRASNITTLPSVKTARSGHGTTTAPGGGATARRLHG